MRSLFLLLLSGVCLFVSGRLDGQYALALHGGAGNISEEYIQSREAELLHDKLEEALNKGESLLADGISSLDVVETVIRMLEDFYLFNAGKGAVFNHDGRHELDASIMEGAELNAGAVAGVGDLKNPISAARLVMERSPHVLLAGAGASAFAAAHGAEVVDSAYFFTEKRWKFLEKQRAVDQSTKFGTVGCVALDIHGNLAAGTSTGGMSNKQPGRVGDSPIIAAGTYADNQSCAVSATGHGEFFIRYAVAYDISAVMKYRQMDLQHAADEVILHKLKPAGAGGGVICVDRKGNVAVSYNTTGMMRAWVNARGERQIRVLD